MKAADIEVAKPERPGCLGALVLFISMSAIYGRRALINLTRGAKKRFFKTEEFPCACRIRLGDEMGSWTPGKSLVFDDTYEHEVGKATPKGVRAILFLDFVRPLPWPLSVMNRLAVRCITYLPFIIGLNNRLKDWEIDHGAELDALARSARAKKKPKATEGTAT